MSVTRDQVMTALAAKLATIKPANGYTTDFGSRVYIWHGYEITGQDAPCILANDTEAVREGYQSNGTVTILTVEITMVAAKACAPAQARAMESDLEDCLPISEQLGGLVSWTKLESTRLVMEQHEQLTAAVFGLVKLRYVH